MQGCGDSSTKNTPPLNPCYHLVIILGSGNARGGSFGATRDGAGTRCELTLGMRVNGRGDSGCGESETVTRPTFRPRHGLGNGQVDLTVLTFDADGLLSLRASIKTIL
jgi:hypothetical protein